MGKPLDIRVQVDKAREAYEIAICPDITMLYNHSLKWGVDPEQYSDSDAPYLTYVREFLRDLQIDYRMIIQRHYDGIASQHGDKRAQMLIDWLKPGGETRQLSYWQRKELHADRRRLEIIIRAYRHL